jgi:hypothetical protein
MAIPVKSHDYEAVFSRRNILHPEKEPKGRVPRTWIG